jgi:peptidoglycan/xylan/chitin deacetylase (PgdA/CDA1 family)
MLRHALAPVVPAFARALELPRTAPRAGGVVVTFDDGPHPEGTPAVLEVLAGADIRAVFFMIGEQVERRPQLAVQVLAAGHAVALHGYRHRLQLTLSGVAVRADIERGRGVLEDAIGSQLAWHRPPYGIYSAAGLRAVREAGLAPLLWSRWGKDWRKWTTPGRIAARSLAGVGAGDVLLLHDADFYSSRDSHLRTVEALGLIVTELKNRGLGTVLPV